jgi:hypothetical protein
MLIIDPYPIMDLVAHFFNEVPVDLGIDLMEYPTIYLDSPRWNRSNTRKLLIRRARDVVIAGCTSYPYEDEQERKHEF